MLTEFKDRTPFMLPVCVTVKFTEQEDHDLRPTVKIEADHIATAIAGYWRWVAEGKRPHHSEFQSRDDKRKPQYFHDNYHNHVEYDETTDEYSFRIQIYDSDMGDDWLTGRCKLGGGVITIIEKTIQHT